MGYSVGSLLAGLGVGGAALAFASKDALANIFGSIVVFLDRPFKQGDYVTIDSVEGTVEEIGVRTTRIRTLANSLITIPNSDFTVKHIINWSKRLKRELKFHVGVTYSTKPEEIEKLVERIKQVVIDDPGLYEDNIIVTLDNFGPSSLDIFVHCYTKTIVWKEYHEAKEKFMLNIMREVEDLNLSFAFPSQSLYIESMPK